MKAIAYNINAEEKEQLMLANYKKHDITIIANSLNKETLAFVKGKEALLVFNDDQIDREIIAGLKELGVKYIATASFDTNHIDLKAASIAGLKIANVHIENEKATSLLVMQRLIKSLDQWTAGKCLGKACCCSKDCAAAKL